LRLGELTLRLFDLALRPLEILLLAVEFACRRVQVALRLFQVVARLTKIVLRALQTIQDDAKEHQASDNASKRPAKPALDALVPAAVGEGAFDAAQNGGRRLPQIEGIRAPLPLENEALDDRVPGGLRDGIAHVDWNDRPLASNEEVDLLADMGRRRRATRADDDQHRGTREGAQQRAWHLLDWFGLPLIEPAEYPLRDSSLASPSAYLIPSCLE
jgi:hypothetical protein